jgi:transcriptional regulator of NAD metabolism
VGCWGVIEEANHSAEIELLIENGYKIKDIIRKFRIFGGSKISEQYMKLWRL